MVFIGVRVGGRMWHVQLDVRNIVFEVDGGRFTFG